MSPQPAAPRIAKLLVLPPCTPTIDTSMELRARSAGVRTDEEAIMQQTIAEKRCVVFDGLQTTPIEISLTALQPDVVSGPAAMQRTIKCTAATSRLQLPLELAQRMDTVFTNHINKLKPKAIVMGSWPIEAHFLQGELSSAMMRAIARFNSTVLHHRWLVKYGMKF